MFNYYVVTATVDHLVNNAGIARGGLFKNVDRITDFTPTMVNHQRHLICLLLYLLLKRETQHRIFLFGQINVSLKKNKQLALSKGTQKQLNLILDNARLLSFTFNK